MGIQLNLNSCKLKTLPGFFYDSIDWIIRSVKIGKSFLTSIFILNLNFQMCRLQKEFKEIQ